jgi:hypothetical protein
LKDLRVSDACEMVAWENLHIASGFKVKESQPRHHSLPMPSNLKWQSQRNFRQHYISRLWRQTVDRSIQAIGGVENGVAYPDRRGGVSGSSAFDDISLQGNFLSGKKNLV